MYAKSKKIQFEGGTKHFRDLSANQSTEPEEGMLFVHCGQFGSSLYCKLQTSSMQWVMIMHKRMAATCDRAVHVSLDSAGAKLDPNGSAR